MTRLRRRLAGLLRALARRVEPPGHVRIVPGTITADRIGPAYITNGRITHCTISEPKGRRES